MSGLHAGAGRARIRFPDAVWPIDGYTGERDPLFVRALLLDGDRRIVWIVVDLTSVAPRLMREIVELVSSIAGVRNEDVMVSVTHTFSAPHLGTPATSNPADAERDRLAQDALCVAAAEATGDAVRSLRPAGLSAGAGVCDVNVNRDVETAQGWALGVDETGFSDKTVTVALLHDADGGPIAVILNYAVQPSVMNESIASDGARLATGDLAGAAASHVERALPGTVALFVIGAAGDQAPALRAVRDSGADRADAGSAGFVLVDLLGERLGTEVVRLASTLSPAVASPGVTTRVALVGGGLTVPGQEPTPRERFTPRRSHRFVPAEDRTLPYWLLQIGELMVVGVQPELSARTGCDLRAASPFPHTMVATMVNGGAKYLPDAGAFERITYEAMSSRYAKGAAESLVTGILNALGDLITSPQPGRSTR